MNSKLTFVKKLDKDKSEFKCECGNTTIQRPSEVKKEYVISCGCAKRPFFGSNKISIMVIFRAIRHLHRNFKKLPLKVYYSKCPREGMSP